jgi:hypothetical protein
MGETLPTPREAMAYAVQSARSGDHEMAQAWVIIARELREGSRPKRLASGGIVGSLGDFRLAPGESDEDVLYGYRRGQQRPPSLTAYRAAVELRKALDEGRELPLHGALHIDRAALDSLVNEIIMRRPEGWESLPEDDPLRSMDDFRQRVVFGGDATRHRGDAEVAYAAFGDRVGIVAGQIETDAQREQRFAFAPPQRPYVNPDRWDGLKSYIDKPDREEHTRVLDAGDPTHCRHCGVGIYEVNPSNVGTGHRYRHDGTGQAICPVAPRGTDGNGDESYVTGTHTFAEPGGLPYRAE